MRDVSYSTTSVRVKAGKIEENKAIDRLQKQGWTVSKASNTDDRINKIDCYLNGKAAQIKVRATGDDLIVEVWRPYYGPNLPNEAGRDYKGSYELYVIVGRNDEPPKVYSRSEIKLLITSVLERWEQAGYVLKQGRSKTYTDSLTGAMICVKEDNWDLVQKLLVYVPQKMLKEKHPNEDSISKV